MFRNTIALFALVLSAFACGGEDSSTAEATDTLPAKQQDVHSFADPDEAVIRHLDLDIDVDFAQQIISGVARYRIETARNADTLTLDTKGLQIERVTVGGQDVQYAMGEADEMLGSPLYIPITADATDVAVHYRTTREGAAALDWLTPEQTLDKTQPFLFTQGQAILTRTWIPIQDSPGIRITYDAHVSVPPGILAVMSAENPQEMNAEGEYDFKMEQSIPPYLIALAAGDLRFEPVGDRTGVYAEPGMIDRAAAELEDMEQMVEAAEKLYGPYDWERFDVIVLPPSFPFGGMENPRLTFATPTIIAGDKSLVSLIAHELAHSWSGNLVTNATWDDFWLNEGFTTYIENRIMEEMYGEEYARMLAQLGYQDLEAEVDDFGADSPDTHLKLHLAGRDPDDGMTNIAYEKGAHFLRMLEQKAGRERFDTFVRQYFADHRFQTLNTEEFVDYLQENLIDRYDLDVDVQQWVYSPGLPDDLPQTVSHRFDSVDFAVEQFLEGLNPADLPFTGYTTHERLHFIRRLPANLNREQMQKLDQAYYLSNSGNSEVLAAWFELAIRNGYAREIMPKIEQFLVRIGRRKFLTPLYRAMMENGMQAEAQAIFSKASPGYHPVSRNSIANLVGSDG